MNPPGAQPDRPAESPTPRPHTAEERRGAWRWLARESLGTATVFALLFGISGRWTWLGAWLTVAVYVVWVAASAALLMPRSPGLLAERARRQRSMTLADNLVLGIFGMAVMAKYVLAALQVRWGGSGSMGAGATWAGLAAAVAGYGLVTWSMVANAFFSMVVRIQRERGHTVAQGGPYRFVRHPGYLGAALFEVGISFVLGSTWALGMGLVGAASMVVRTALEDRTLQEHLPGYREYALKTRHRLIPGVW